MTAATGRAVPLLRRRRAAAHQQRPGALLRPGPLPRAAGHRAQGGLARPGGARRGAAGRRRSPAAGPPLDAARACAADLRGVADAAPTPGDAPRGAPRPAPLPPRPRRYLPPWRNSSHVKFAVLEKRVSYSESGTLSRWRTEGHGDRSGGRPGNAASARGCRG